VRRALANLIQNAIRYTNDKIEVATGVDKKFAYFTVSDNGQGIAEADIERLFQPFTQGDTARGTDGSGLGLAIIKRIVNNHGGHVVLTNRPEGGLKATVSLPIKFVGS
jgi:two-component system osmolarity sensor histidine kinase EnvZ